MTPAELRRSRIAVLAYFFVLGAATATWSARLPAIKAALHLSDGRLGLALFAVPAGSVVTLAVSGRIADRFGPDRVIRAGGLACPLALVPIGAAGDLGWLMAALACYGAMAGLLDVAMNACGARLEVGYGRPILSSLHAGYSIAGLAGAGIGALSAGLGLGVLPTLAATAAVLIAAGLVAGPRVAIPSPAPPSASPGDEPSGTPRASPGGHSVPRRHPGPRRPGTPRFSARIPPWALILSLGLLALAGQVGEGSAGDWSAVYLHVNLHSSVAFAAAGLAAFSVMMAAGRVAGDRLAGRFGPVRLVRASGLLAGLGLAAGLRIGTPAAAVAGFALLGAGLAGIFPQIVSAAVRLDPARAGRAIGRIAAIAYSGLLSGPVVIGALASGVGLRDALLLPAALSVLVALLAGLLSAGSRAGARPAAAARPAR